MSTGAPLVMCLEPRRVQLVRGLDELRHAATLREEDPATVNALNSAGPNAHQRGNADVAEMFVRLPVGPAGTDCCGDEGVSAA